MLNLLRNIPQPTKPVAPPMTAADLFIILVIPVSLIVALVCFSILLHLELKYHVFHRPLFSKNKAVGKEA